MHLRNFAYGDHKDKWFVNCIIVVDLIKLRQQQNKENF